jgi:hypothetical protein
MILDIGPRTISPTSSLIPSSRGLRLACLPPSRSLRVEAIFTVSVARVVRWSQRLRRTGSAAAEEGIY